MKSGSWSSYQSALPPEARIGGEPDDEPLGGPEAPPGTKTCATCRHWRTDATIINSHEWRICRAVGNTYPTKANRQGALPLATVYNVSNYDATLHTRADFGCVLHEEKT